MADSTVSIENTLIEMLQLMRSMNGMMERREHREAANAATTPNNEAAGPTQPMAAQAGAGGAPSTTTALSVPASPLTPATQSTPAAQATGEHGDGDSMTVVGQLSRIVDALKDVGLIRSGKKEDEKKSAFRRKRFGLNFNQAQRGNENYDYTLKYDEDEDPDENGNLKELSEEARVFWVYNDEAKMFDDDLVAELGDGLDLSLIFSALFSAILTTFVVQTSVSLSPDNADDSTFHPATTDLWVNGLWFVCLTLSLAVALFSVLAKQWLRQYMSIVTGTPRERAFIRQFRYDGLMKWRIPTIIGIIPVILHLSVVLFLIGLTIFLIPLSHSMAGTTGGLTALIVALYIYTTVVPLFALECPYRTTFTDLIYSLHRRVLQTLWITLYFLDKQLPATIHIVLSRKKLTRERPIDSFDFVEREAACPPDRPNHDQKAELQALSWLVHTTSSPSAKTVVFESIGAFHPKMNGAILEGVLYSSNAVTRTVSDIRQSVAHRYQRVARTLVHCKSFWKMQMGEVYYADSEEHVFPPALLLTWLAAGWSVDLPIESIPPRIGLFWACQFWQQESLCCEVPELIWANLCSRAARDPRRELIPLESVPLQILYAIQQESWGEHAPPHCLGNGVTMEDVDWELRRRGLISYWEGTMSRPHWMSSIPQNVPTSWTRAGTREKQLRDWMEGCRQKIGSNDFDRWRARAKRCLETGSEADGCCDREWEQAARLAFDGLLSRADDLDYTYWTNRLKAMDIEGEVKHWRERNTLVLDRIVSELKREMGEEEKSKAAMQSETPFQARLRWIRKWLPNRSAATESVEMGSV